MLEFLFWISPQTLTRHVSIFIYDDFLAWLFFGHCSFCHVFLLQSSNVVDKLETLMPDNVLMLAVPMFVIFASLAKLCDDKLCGN